MAEGSNPTDRDKLGTKRRVLTDKEGIPLSVVMSSAIMNDVKLLTGVVDNAVAKRHISSLYAKTGIKRKLQHLCLDKAYNSKPQGQAIAKRGYVIHLPHKRKRGEVKKDMEKKKSRRKKHPARGWVVERTNAWHSRFRKTVYSIRKEDGKLPWFGTVLLLDNHLQKDNFGTGCMKLNKKISRTVSIHNTK
jgi:transposase